MNSSDAMNAIEYFKRAASTGEDFYGAAHVGITWCSIKTKTIVKRNEIDRLEKALSILANEMALFDSIKVLMQNAQSAFTNSDLYRQLTIKSTILGSYLNSVQNCIAVFKRSLRLIQVVKTSIDKKDEEAYYDLERNEQKKVDMKWEKQARYRVCFHDLTRREDSGTIDQALQTIDCAYKIDTDAKFKDMLKAKPKRNLSVEYNGIALKLEQINLGRLKTILNRDKEFEEMNNQEVISRLKMERSVLNSARLTDSYETDLKITYSDSTHNTLINQQINKLINVIHNRMNETTLRYGLRIKESNVNEINQHFRKSPTCTSNIRFRCCSLDNASLMNLISKVNCSISIDMSLKKSALSASFVSLFERSHTSLQHVRVCIYKPKEKCAKYKRVKIDDFTRKIDEMRSEETVLYLILDDMGRQEAQSIVDALKESKVVFNATFSCISFNDFWKLLNDREILERNADFWFDNLNKLEASEFIKTLRQNRLEFCLEFKNLDKNQAKYIIKNANLEQEEIEVSHVKSLAELFLKCMFYVVSFFQYIFFS